MADRHPPPEQFEAWVAGTLPEGAAREVDAYFERHPDALAAIELERGILRDAAASNDPDPQLRGLIESLKAQSFDTRSEDRWMEIIQPTDRPGQLGTLGNYDVLEVLAVTGMAVVLKAFDPELDRLVAIKILSHGLAADPGARTRFLREARAMATLEHENILPIFGIHPEPVPWFAMRYIGGGSLQDAIDAEHARLADPSFLESLATQMAGALAKAHASGIIHRDLKPANILLDDDGEHCWLTDFGIARSANDPGLTLTHAIAGTPRYMSPEQAAGRKVDARSDLFSLGSVLFHCATGRPPFEGDHQTAVIDLVKRGNAPPVARLNPSLPSWLSRSIDELLSNDPERRPDSADALLARLAARAGSRQRPRRWLPVAAACAGCGIAIWALVPDSADPPPSSAPQNSTAPNTVFNTVTGTHYPDLSRAITEAPSGATLELNGWFTLEEPIATRTRFDLHLRAADGAEATVEFKHLDDYGILIEGNASAEGIAFLCTERIEENFIFLVTRDAERLEIRNCTFDDRIPEGLSWALKAESVDETVMDSCRFFGKELVASIVNDSLEATSPRRCHFLMRDCQLEARAITMTRGRRPETEFDITLERNVLRGHTVIGYSSYNEPRPTRITARDNQFLVSSRHLHIARGPVQSLAETLVWRGERNTYTAGTPFVRLSRPETQFLESLDDFLAAVPGAADTGARFHDPDADAAR